MNTFSGRYPFTSLYFLRAFITAGRMLLVISWPESSWRLQLLVNLIKLEVMRRKTNLISH